MRKRFDEQLALLNKELTSMGAFCEESIASAAKALSTGDKALIQKTAVLNQEVRQQERDVEALCLKLLLQQQPVAKDLRQVSAALKMITDLERISEQASDVGEIVNFMNDSALPRHERINEMAKATIKMVTESVDAYVKRSVSLAEAVMEYDDVVDQAFNDVKKDLIQQIAENPDSGEYALDLLMIAKYLEGIGDHAVNVAGWVKFSILGHTAEEEQ